MHLFLQKVLLSIMWLKAKPNIRSLSWTSLVVFGTFASMIDNYEYLDLAILSQTSWLCFSPLLIIVNHAHCFLDFETLWLKSSKLLPSSSAMPFPNSMATISTLQKTLHIVIEIVLKIGKFNDMPCNDKAQSMFNVYAS